MSQALQISEEAMTGLEVATRDLRLAEAKRIDHLARGFRALPPGKMPERAYLAEAALIFGCSEHRVKSLLGLALTLSDEYIDTAGLVRDARLTLRHAEVITDAGRVITNITAAGCDDAAIAHPREQQRIAEARRKEYEQAVLPHALELTPNRLAPVAKRLAEQWAVEPIEERQAREAARRRVAVVPLDDGMAELRAYMPAVQAYGLFDHLTRIGKAAKRKTIQAPPIPGVRTTAGSAEPAPELGEAPAADDTRGLDQIRVGALYDLLSRDPFDAAAIASGTSGSGLQGRVQLVVTAEGFEALVTKHGGTVMRDTAYDPGAVKCALKGYGPIGIDSARPLIASQTRWDVVTVCKHTGSVIRTDSYRPNRAQVRFVSARDEHCRHPGCMAPVYRSEIDHTIDAALGGPTATDNLAHLCLMHHILKGESDWTVVQGEGGVLVWTSPTGRTYVERPPDLLPELTSVQADAAAPWPEAGQDRQAANPAQRSHVRFEADDDDQSGSADGNHPF
ncbi:HNH endonuclease signature motif containing protein [Leucobacter sp. G161]|uniref:HNH endonuclease signature motif containing protein n=1 Tax=Leucobacter sp. G161 TaxID=663704 RepID=UPI0009F8F028|nr:HNH endonuclease signature motif containing protein [Leucobacter sp. G161]